MAKPETIPLALSSVKSALGDDCQGSLVFLAPEVMRQKLREMVKKNIEQQQAAPGDAGPGLAQGFLAPLQNIKSLSLGLKFGLDVDVLVAGDLGSAQDAQQEAILMQNVMMPIVQGMLTQQSQQGDEPPDIAKSLKVENVGTTVTIRFKITEKDMMNRINAAQPPMVLGPAPIQ